MNHILSEIRKCDVILRCGKERYIGLLYDSAIADSPIVKCKREYNYNYLLMKAGERAGVPCVEHKLLVRELFDKLEIGDPVPCEYFKVLAPIYSNLEKYKKKNEEHDDVFIEKLTRDLGNQIYSSEKKAYKKVLRKTLKKEEHQQQTYEDDIVQLFEEELRKISEKFDITLRNYHNAAFNTDEFYLEKIVTEYRFEFWQMVLISQEDKKIIIGTRYFFDIFDFSETLIALEVFKALADECYTDLEKNIISFCEQAKTNPKICEIVESTIKVMLEMNYQESGIEYGFYCDTVVITVYLRPANSLVMYQILVWIQEFLKSPQTFKNAIKELNHNVPKGYGCKKKKYNPRFLDEKFQPITP